MTKKNVIDSAHVDAILAALDALRPFAEARYPTNAVRASAYVAVVVEDLQVALTLAVTLGVSLDRLPMLIGEASGKGTEGEQA